MYKGIKIVEHIILCFKRISILMENEWDQIYWMRRQNLVSETWIPKLSLIAHVTVGWLSPSLRIFCSPMQKNPPKLKWWVRSKDMEEQKCTFLSSLSFGFYHGLMVPLNWRSLLHGASCLSSLVLGSGDSSPTASLCLLPWLCASLFLACFMVSLY